MEAMSEAIRTMLLVVLFFLAMLGNPCLRCVIGEDPPAGRSPVPPSDLRAEKADQINQLLGVDGLTTSGAKTEMFHKLVEISGQSKSDQVARFALLNMARKLAEDMGDIDLAFQAIDRLAQNFAFDANQVRLIAFKNSLQSGVDRVAHRDRIQTIGLTEIERLADEGEFGRAIELSKLLSLGLDSRADPQFASILESRSRIVAERAAHHAAFQTALATLTNSPSDADANAVAAIHFLLEKRDWRSAARHAEQSNRPKLRQICDTLLIKSPLPTGVLQLADQWREIATELTGHRKLVALQQSAAAYERASEQLTGLEQIRARKAIEELRGSGIEFAPNGDSVDELLPTRGAVTGQVMPILHDGIVSCRWMGKRSLDVMPLIQTNIHTVSGTWSIENEKLVGTSSKSASIRLPVVAPDEYELTFDAEVKSALNLTIRFPSSTGRRCTAILGSPSKSPANGFEFIDDKPWNSNVSTVQGSLMKQHQTHAVKLLVRRGRIEVWGDGELGFRFDGDESRITPTHHWEGPDETTLLLGTSSNTVSFSDIRLVSLVDRDELQQRPYPARSGQIAEWYRKDAFDPPPALFRYRKINLDQYPEMSFRTHWGLLGKGGYTAPPNGKPDQGKIGKEPFSTGIWMHTKDNGSAWVSYYLGGRYQTFRALTGINGTSTKKLKGRVTFSVHGDGKILASRPAVRMRNDWKPIEADLTNVQTLTLKVDCAGKSNYAAGFWAGAVLEK